jgi:DHA3 family macrolide efflux protein-like MFS transporter
MSQSTSWKKIFGAFWTAQAFSLFGSGLSQFALIWWITQTTGSATMLAVASMVGLLPMVVLGPLVGVLVDRWNRKTILMISDGVSALGALLLALLFLSGQIQIWHVFVVIFVRAVAGAFQFPAVQSSTSLMVPEAHLARVAGLNQALQGATSIATPPLGALLIGLIPLGWIMSIDVITALVAVSLLGFIHIPRPPLHPTTVAAQPSIFSDLRAGFAYIFNWPGLLGILLIATLLNLVLAPAFSLVPILVVCHFGGEVLQLGWMSSVFGLGTVIGGLLLGAWGGFNRRIYTIILGLVGLGLGALMVGLAPSYAFGIGLTGMLVMGLMNPIANGPFFAILQSVVPPQMQGRVFTTMLSITMGVSPLGLAVAGPLSDLLGVQLWYLVAAVICLVLTVVVMNSRSILHLEQAV